MSHLTAQNWKSVWGEMNRTVTLTTPTSNALEIIKNLTLVSNKNLSTRVTERWVRSYSGYCFLFWVLWFGAFKSLTCSEPQKLQISLSARVCQKLHSLNFGHSNLHLQIQSYKELRKVHFQMLFIVIKMSPPPLFFWVMCIACRPFSFSASKLKRCIWKGVRCSFLLTASRHEMKGKGAVFLCETSTLLYLIKKTFVKKKKKKV